MRLPPSYMSIPPSWIDPAALLSHEMKYGFTTAESIGDGSAIHSSSFAPLSNTHSRTGSLKSRHAWLRTGSVLNSAQYSSIVQQLWQLRQSAIACPSRQFPSHTGRSAAPQTHTGAASVTDTSVAGSTSNMQVCHRSESLGCTMPCSA